MLAASVRGCFSWKNLPFERLFQVGCFIDTLKNRVVTSELIWLLSVSPAVFQIIEELLDTAQRNEMLPLVT